MFDFFWVPLMVAVVSAMATLTLRPLAALGGLLDRPGGRKRHGDEVPLVGGLAIVIAVWVGAILFMRGQGYYVALLGGITVLAGVGLVDDFRGMSPLTKLGFQIFAAILMTSWGGVFLMSLGDLLGKRDIELINWGIPLTLFAVVAVINAMNMVDGLDGLAGGLAFIVFAWMVYLAGEVQNNAAQRLCAVFCGALLGFLFFNAPHPLRGKRRVFLGDAGSMMLGFAIVWFAVELSQPAYNAGKHVPPVVMLWVTGFILIDLLAVVVRRALLGRNPLSADRTHMHHLLLRLNLSPRFALLIILVSNILLGLCGVLAWKAGVPEPLMFLGFVVAAFLHLLVMSNVSRFLRRLRAVMRRFSKNP
ncbi:undecaprenyl/decaprenyl-phosphate alpha-N-acetylglucosaminyl 1-phosphate transferase [Cupriavidus pinatubonensis]|uniref:MraY family glycosyltransferase n=1 Tax=Cupriavidus pinatubonensis TaxID=248026 RepID=UPI001C732027|nr:MraY family glycosyltransferase [Cupriavidus pinatubonensis]QYY32314.1 undecaprenyl/decaprenyl-phosphate alpha-N-acetylglucosaminyl 1-phosphate transferase [Cupriavidus pinatubonensis]